MTHVTEGETTRGRNDSGRNDSGRTGKWAKRPVTLLAFAAWCVILDAETLRLLSFSVGCGIPDRSLSWLLCRIV